MGRNQMASHQATGQDMGMTKDHRKAEVWLVTRSVETGQESRISLAESRRILARRRTDDEKAMGKLSFPVYALEGWQGPRYFAVTGRSSKKVISAGLGHGAPEDEVGPLAFVESLVPQTAIWGDPESFFSQMLWQNPGTKPEEVARRYAAEQPESHQSLAVEFLGFADRVRVVDARLSFDRTPVPASVVDFGQRWLAQADFEDYLVRLDVRGMARSELRCVRIHDIEPYIVGQRSLEEGQRRRSFPS